MAEVVQGATGLAFGAFASVHIANHLVALVSQRWFDRVQMALREVYVPLEWIGGPVLVAHVAVGIRRLIQRRKFSAARREVQLMRAAGYVLTASLPYHIWQMRYVPAALDMHADFSYVHHELRSGLGVVVHGTGLAFFLCCGLFHTGYGAVSALQQLGAISAHTSASLHRQQMRLLPLGAVTAAFVVAAFSGGLYTVRTLRM